MTELEDDGPTVVQRWIADTAARHAGPGPCRAHCPWMLATDCDLPAGHAGDHAYLLTWRQDPRA